MQQLDTCPIERHPLQPFLPPDAKLLMLGSFPPAEKRWSMRFFYPNYINDMWRIVGTCFFEDAHHFVLPEERTFKEEELRSFLMEKGIALYDSAVAIRRLSGNASDKDLEVVETTDIESLLDKIPFCTSLVTTGQKATEIVCDLFHVKPPTIGKSVKVVLSSGRVLAFFRMPSSSRAYPMKLEKKAEVYSQMFQEIGLL